MKNFMLEFLRIVFRYSLACVTWDQWSVRSWSQEGEDIILNRIFRGKRSGFYVDIGAHHPKRFSNTFLFYKLGWRGINVDAMPGSMHAFKKHRPRDINIEVGIGKHNDLLDYFIFNEPALNSFNQGLSQDRHVESSGYFIKEVIKVPLLGLSDLLNQFLPSAQNIDFLSIDVEGHDLQVLKSNDWAKYRPTFVLVEILGNTLDEINKSDIVVFMSNNKYVLYAKTHNTAFFKDSSCL